MKNKKNLIISVFVAICIIGIIVFCVFNNITNKEKEKVEQEKLLNEINNEVELEKQQDEEVVIEEEKKEEVIEEVIENVVEQEEVKQTTTTTSQATTNNNSNSSSNNSNSGKSVSYDESDYKIIEVQGDKEQGYGIEYKEQEISYDDYTSMFSY